MIVYCYYYYFLLFLLLIFPNLFFIPSFVRSVTRHHITMPYNTRRKSLSLPSLGIHLPNSSRRSPPASKGSNVDEVPPTKKVKRSHASLSPEPKEPVRAIRNGLLEHTPPPSPLDSANAPKIDTEGIDDDIVVAAIEQLEKTGNRPHLVKELAAVLIAQNATVAM